AWMVLRIPSAAPAEVERRREMSSKDDVALLKGLPLFARVDSSHLNVLGFALERTELENDETLFRDGDAGEGAFLVTAGNVVLARRIAGREATVNAGRCTLIGEQSMFADVPYRGTAKASERTTVLRIGRDLFYKLAEEFPDLAVEAMRSVNEKLN